MARILTAMEIRELVTGGQVIQGADPDCAEGIKYDFRLGDRVMLPQAHILDVRELNEADRSKLELAPGAMCFVMTRERLNLPADVVVQLSQKRKLAHEGVLVGGGSNVDPLYRGPLVLVLYNFSTVPFPIKPGKKIIAGVFLRLDPAEAPTGDAPQPIEDFPEDVERIMRTYRAMPAGLLGDQVETLASRVKSLEDSIADDKWQREFKEALKEQSKALVSLEKTVETLVNGLSTERDLRKGGDDELSSRQQRVDERLGDLRDAVTVSKVYWALLGALLLAAAGVVAAWLLSK